MVLLRRLRLEAEPGRRHRGQRLAAEAVPPERTRAARIEQLDESRVLDVPRGRDDHVGADVGGGVVLGQRVPVDRCDHVRSPDHRPTKRVAAEDRLGDDVVHEVLRRVLDHRDLLEHDLALGVDLGEGGLEDHVRDHVERGLEPLVGHAGVDDRRLARRGGVQLAAERVEDLGDLLGAVAAGALEEEVLDEVGDASASLGLVAGAGADPEAERDRADARNVLADHPFSPGQRRQLVLNHRRIVQPTSNVAPGRHGSPG